MKTKLLKIKLTIVCTILVQQSLLTAKPSLDPHVEDYLNFLSDANQYSPMEGAGSHGSVGIGLGVGGSVHGTPAHRELLNDQLRNRTQFSSKDSQQTPDRLMVPRLLMHKGLPFPVDIGGTVAKIPNTDATSAGVYLQWTLFEGFALPALSIRGKYSRMMGLPSTEFSTTSAEAGASYGFFRIFNIYATIGLNQQRSSISTSGETGTSLVTDEENLDSHKDVRINQNQAVGMQLQILPPFCTTTIETRTLAKQRTWLAKISVGL